MKLTQSASAVWMIRPLVFYGNPETPATNTFQQSVSIASMSVVLQEFDTNVVMNVGDAFAVICSEAISDPEGRRMVFTSLEASGRELIHVDQQQMHSFAGNMPQLCNAAQQKNLVMSSTAHSSFNEVQIAALEKYARILVVDIPTIEQQGGGSIRCMLSEIFLPKK
jgi:hypothetical protein